MAARERYNVPLKCTGCGATGSAGISEEDHMFTTSLDRRVDSVEGPFVEVDEAKMKFKCTKCGTAF